MSVLRIWTWVFMLVADTPLSHFPSPESVWEVFCFLLCAVLFWLPWISSSFSLPRNWVVSPGCLAECLTSHLIPIIRWINFSTWVLKYIRTLITFHSSFGCLKIINQNDNFHEIRHNFLKFNCRKSKSPGVSDCTPPHSLFLYQEGTWSFC